MQVFGLFFNQMKESVCCCRIFCNDKCVISIKQLLEIYALESFAMKGVMVLIFDIMKHYVHREDK